MPELPEVEIVKQSLSKKIERKKIKKIIITNRNLRFKIPLKFIGTYFQKKVWQELMKIPFGETICYQELARRIGDIKMARAVGNANGKNPISIVVPCHRVIAKNGTIGGFTGGIEKKIFLLNLENHNF